MIVVALTVLWAGQLVAGVLFFALLVVLGAAFARFFTGRARGVGWTLERMADPLLRPLRRRLAPLRLRLDLAPFLAAAALYGAEVLIAWGAGAVASALVGPLGPPRSGALRAIVEGLRIGLYAYLFLVFARLMITWVGAPAGHSFARFLARAVDPVLARLGWLPRAGAARVDLAPLVLVAAILFVDRVVLESVLYLF